MKKTIAILLILVIGMVGVFAAIDAPDPNSVDTKLTLKTSVSSILETKLLTTKLSALTRAAFETDTSSTNLNGKDVTVARGDANKSIGFLYVMSNYIPGYTLSLDGKALRSAADVDEEGTTIKYTISAGSATLDLVTPTNDFDLKISPLSGLTVTEYEVKVTLDSTTYDLAQAADDYTADVTFTFTAN